MSGKYLHFYAGHDMSIVSDHYGLVCTLSVPKPLCAAKVIGCRKFKQIDIGQFKNDLMNSSLYVDGVKNVTASIDKYNECLSRILDKHAPAKQIKVKVKSRAPWYNGEIHYEKLARRKLECRWLRSKSENDMHAFRKIQDHVNNLIRYTKTVYYQEKFKNAVGQKEIFKLTYKLLNSKPQNLLPSCTSESILANRFSNFFTEKINKIHDDLRHNVVNSNPLVPAVQTVIKNRLSCLTSFGQVSADVVIKVIQSMANKSCLLDPIPTWLLNSCLPELVPDITKIINTMLEKGTIPVELKQAIVSPILKNII